jgi:hypothetical protein
MMPPLNVAICGEAREAVAAKRRLTNPLENQSPMSPMTKRSGSVTNLRTGSKQFFVIIIEAPQREDRRVSACGLDGHGEQLKEGVSATIRQMGREKCPILSIPFGTPFAHIARF